MELTIIKKDINNYFRGTKAENKVRKAESINIRLQDIDDSRLNNWELKFKYGEVIKNNYGKKLYFKFGMGK